MALITGAPQTAANKRLADQYIVFVLDQQKYGLAVSAVEQVLRIVEITPLPKAPEIVLGVINVRGRIVPVLDIRKRFRLKAREITLADQIIVAGTSARAVGLVVDAVEGIVECRNVSVTAAASIVPGMEFVTGVVKTRDGMILIHDLDRFLSLEEEAALGEAFADG